MADNSGGDRPELADAGRLARKLVGRAVRLARTEDQPLRRLLLDFLGPDAATLPTVSATWPSYEHVNVQVGLEAWLESGTERTHEVFGITGIGMMRHMEIVGIGEFLQPLLHCPRPRARSQAAIQQRLARIYNHLRRIEIPRAAQSVALLAGSVRTVK